MVTQPPPRDRLLDAADALLFTAGIAATPVDVILNKANTAPATLYAHFGNKDGLVTEALRRRLTIWDREWQTCIESASGDNEKLLAVFAALRAYRSKHLAARWCGFLGTAAETNQHSKELEAVLMDETNLLTSRLQKLAEPVAGANAETLAKHLALIVSGVLAMMLRDSLENAITSGEETARILVDACTPKTM
ncbi:TetR/AcrR family transcriptional regulator [Arthrobacter sp. H14]|uniref:TetR/AcrR family transcriptional regulator n=1 Tax=Arthrobacter sp. H14 TaxID=1312959 RepID=UPI00047BF452|nr:TetR/AcrR family transcriptional regulator [Arthrobacter sp. H14]